MPKCIHYRTGVFSFSSHLLFRRNLNIVNMLSGKLDAVCAFLSLRYLNIQRDNMTSIVESVFKPSLRYPRFSGSRRDRKTAPAFLVQFRKCDFLEVPLSWTLSTASTVSLRYTPLSWALPECNIQERYFTKNQLIHLLTLTTKHSTTHSCKILALHADVLVVCLTGR